MKIEEYDAEIGFAARGACRGKPTSWWFPPKDGVASREERRRIVGNQRAAVVICKSCEVRRECLAFAVKWNERGIWGGVGEKQRKRLRRDRPEK